MPLKAIHPGAHLAEELTALRMSAAEFARQLRIPTNRVTAILSSFRGWRGVTELTLPSLGARTPAKRFYPIHDKSSDGKAKGQKL